MRLRRVGTAALLIECQNGEQVEAWRHEIWQRREAGEIEVVDVVPGAHTLLLDGVPGNTAEILSGWAEPAAATTAEGPLIEVATVFDGEDLPDVAERWAVPVDEVVTRLAETRFTVAFCGFAPGFPYLRGLPDGWAVPRLAAPRPRVPAGSVALADAWCGIYPTASPGGWRLVGRTELNLFDVRREPPALLGPGTRVRLVPA